MSIGKTRPFITLQGNGQPTIEWNDTNFLSGNHTFDSATFGVSGNFFMACNFTFKVKYYSPKIPYPIMFLMSSKHQH